MSSSDYDDVALNSFTGYDPETSEEFCSSVCRAAQEEEPPQHREVEVRGTQQATQTAARQLFEQELISEEKQQEQDIEEQSASDSRTEQEISNMPTDTTTPKGLPTDHATASDMFEKTDPLDVSQFKGGTCENP